jgi:2,3-bisphosphoglycerate-independent phosphoglycerate mutase
MNITPALLIILDGFGYREECDNNAICQARKPHWNFLWGTCPHTTIDASDKWVGLPKNQMGNSEVGHMNIGAGRVVYQDYTKIEHAIETGEFHKNPTLLKAIETSKAGTNSALHILGLLSTGGVHSHESQIFALVDMAAAAGVKNIYVHAFLDGRDTPPKSAEPSLVALQKKFEANNAGRIASICGRYFAMDRDKRWERVKPAYDVVTQGKAENWAASAVDGYTLADLRGESDEFVLPTAIVPPGSKPVRINDGDVVVFMNFRADRARQMTAALSDASFIGFAREHQPKLAYFCTLTSYGSDFSNIPPAFPTQSIANGIGEYLAAQGLKQLRIAETEKYAHVTYFFNGGVETPYTGEERIMVPSPRVATYDLQPEMSARDVTAKLVDAINSRKYDAIVCNFANGDMVGHTGNLDATTRAIEVLDECIGRAVTAMRDAGGETLITSDHGNAETMLDNESKQAHTAHTTNLVPLVYVGRKATMAPGGALQDVAPTLLKIMGLPKPAEMTGKALIDFA